MGESFNQTNNQGADAGMLRVSKTLNSAVEVTPSENPGNMSLGVSTWRRHSGKDFSLGGSNGSHTF